MKFYGSFLFVRMDRRDRRLFKIAYKRFIDLKESLNNKKAFAIQFDLLSDLLHTYGTIAFFNPVFAVERNLDTEIWDMVCKDTIQDIAKAVSSFKFFIFIIFLCLIWINLCFSAERVQVIVNTNWVVKF